MIKKTVLTLWLLGCGVFLWANDLTRVSVQADGAQGRLATLTIVPNAFTSEEICVDSCRIDSAGFFAFKVDLPQTMKAYIDIDYYRAYIFIEPGVHYDLQFDPFDYYQDERFTPMQMDFYLAYRIRSIDSNALNYLIWSLDAEVDRFVSQNVEAIERQGRRDLLDSFCLDMQRRFNYSGHAYFVDYLRYTLADLQLIFSTRTHNALFLEHLKERPIPVANCAYAAFMEDFLEGYFPTQVPYSYFVFLDQLHAPSTGLTPMLDSLGRAPIFQNERFREAALLVGMAELALYPDVNPKAVPAFLQYYAAQTKFEELSHWARSLQRQQLSRLPGAQKSRVELPDIHGTRLNIPVNDKPFTYLLFVRDRCLDCPIEIKTLDELPLDTTRVRYVLVNCDYMYEKYQMIASAIKYERVSTKVSAPLPYLHFDKQIRWQKSLGAYSYPHAVLMDAEGRVVFSNFKKPSQGLVRAIDAFLKSR